MGWGLYGTGWEQYVWGWGGDGVVIPMPVFSLYLVDAVSSSIFVYFPQNVTQDIVVQQLLIFGRLRAPLK